MNKLGVFDVLPWIALLLASVSVVLALVMRRDHAKQAAAQVNETMQRALRLLDNYGQTQSGLSALQETLRSLTEKLARLAAEQTLSSRRADQVLREEQEEETGDPRIKQFLDLVMQWEGATGQRLQGAAKADEKAIDELTILGRRAKSTDDAAVFLAAARRVVEYAVRASGSRAVSDEMLVGRVLDQMAALVEIKLIEPQFGQRYNSDWHDVVDKVTAEAGNRRETIAKVEVRGLVRRDGSVMKAKVSLYD